jgi:hypothetical protein
MKTLSFLKNTTKVINKLPFAGKIVIRPVLLSYYSEIDRRAKYVKFIFVFCILLLFVIGHIYQGYLVIDFFLSYNKANRLFALIYAILNFSIAYSQIVLLLRSIIHLLSWRKSPAYHPPNRKIKFYSNRYLIFSLVITVTIQLLFICILNLI